MAASTPSIHECTYLGTKIDQPGENTTETEHRISQTGNALRIQFPKYCLKNMAVTSDMAKKILKPRDQDSVWKTSGQF